MMTHLFSKVQLECGVRGVLTQKSYSDNSKMVGFELISIYIFNYDVLISDEYQFGVPLRLNIFDSV